MKDTSEVKTTGAPATAPGAILEERWLGNNELISIQQADREVAELGPEWRLETPHEAFADIDYDQTNELGALSLNPDRHACAYWTNRPYPADLAARVVVWFDDGYVDYVFDHLRARARAVRVSGQSSAL